MDWMTYQKCIVSTSNSISFPKITMEQDTQWTLNINLNTKQAVYKPFSKPSLQDPTVELDWKTGNASSTEKEKKHEPGKQNNARNINFSK